MGSLHSVICLNDTSHCLHDFGRGLKFCQKYVRYCAACVRDTTLIFTALAGPVKSLAEIEAGLKHATLTPKPDRGRSTPPSIPLGRPGGPLGVGGGASMSQLGGLFAMMGGQTKEDQTAFNRLVSSMRASGNLPASKIVSQLTGRVGVRKPRPCYILQKTLA